MTFDFIIIGLGAMGSAAAFHLAQRGYRVLGLEQFDIPNARGSSHGHSRMIRMAYYEHPDYVPLLRRAYELWHELEERSGQKLLHLTGGIYMGPRDGQVVGGALDAAARHDLPHELIDRAETLKRFPAFQLPEHFVGLWEPNAGFLLPERVVAAHAIEAMKLGAELHAHEAALDWSTDNQGVSVRTAGGVYHAEKLLFCAGPWASSIVKDLGIQLRVTRQALGWLWPRRPDLFAFGRFPVFGIDNPDGSLSYGFPMMSDSPGLKIARHAPGTATDPDRVEREPSAADYAEVHAIARQFLPAGDGPVTALRVCLYTNSPDEHFIIDHHPRRERVVVACGFSGHGFKFSSVVGQILADLAVHGTTALPAQFLGLGRFG